MIKLEHTILPSSEQMMFVIEGMRNPMNSWDKCDSEDVNYLVIGEADEKLMHKLAKAGTDHRKFMRMMPICVRITAPLYWWKEFDTYKVGTVANSCSTMHKIQERDFTLEDFSHEHLTDEKKTILEVVISMLNISRMKFNETKNKDYWWEMIQLLPNSYNQTRNVTLNYEVLANIYKSRKGHKLDEWREFCEWIESLPLVGLIVEEQK